VSPQETARAILALYDGKPERWTKGRLARDKQGDAVNNVRSHRAACWCIAGAAERVLPGPDAHGCSYDRDSYLAFRNLAASLVDPAHDAHWNDAPERTFADVVALLERIAAEPTP
jgi:hypothetical protein